MYSFLLKHDLLYARITGYAQSIYCTSNDNCNVHFKILVRNEFCYIVALKQVLVQKVILIAITIVLRIEDYMGRCLGPDFDSVHWEDYAVIRIGDEQRCTLFIASSTLN